MSNIISKIVTEQEKTMGEANKNVGASAFEFTENEKRIMFLDIDRHQESKDVITFQNTGDMSIMENLYKIRLQTLRIWARKYYYVGMSEEDVFSELVSVFIKSIHKYKKNTIVKHYGKNKKAVVSETPFNTYFYYALQNYVINQWNRKRAKKRMSNDVPAENLTLSLDYPYSNSDDSSCSLIDVIPNNNESERTMMSGIHLQETINLLSNGNEPFRSFLKKLSDDNKLTASLKSLKVTEGRIKLQPTQKSKFESGKKCLRQVSDFIREHKHIVHGFNVINYFVKNDFLHYKIELRKTKEYDVVNREIRRIRRNKDRYRYMLSM